MELRTMTSDGTTTLRPERSKWMGLAAFEGMRNKTKKYVKNGLDEIRCIAMYYRSLWHVGMRKDVFAPIRWLKNLGFCEVLHAWE